MDTFAHNNYVNIFLFSRSGVLSDEQLQEEYADDVHFLIARLKLAGEKDVSEEYLLLTLVCLHYYIYIILYFTKKLFKWYCLCRYVMGNIIHVSALSMLLRPIQLISCFSALFNITDK